MGGIDTPAAENNDRIIRKLCCLSAMQERRNFIVPKAREQHGDRLNIWGVVCNVMSSLLGFPTTFASKDVTEIKQATLF